MSSAVSVDNLHKSYGDREVLKGISFEVHPGEAVALLGPNGAGKTTALSCIEGLCSFSGGSVHVQGTCGIQLQSASLPAHMRAGEAVTLFSRWRGAPADPDTADVLGISALNRLQYGAMSVGQKRRLHLALALIGRPDVLFLDEPTAGLDVEGRVALHHYLHQLKERGITMLLASHDMAEVENLCDRLIILKDGAIAFEGTAADLKEKAGKRYHVSIRTNEMTEQYDMEDVAAELLQVLQTCQEKHLTVQDIRIDRGSLEDQFLQVAQGEEK